MEEELRERYEAFGDESVYAVAMGRYEEAVAGSPANARLLTEYGYLQECHGRRALRAAAEWAAYLSATDYQQAAQVIRAGLDLAPDDRSLVEQQGDLLAATGRPDEALACWQRAFTLAPQDYGISMRYSAADLLASLGRLVEAAQEWRFIVSWCEERGDSITADWPRQELRHLEAMPTDLRHVARSGARYGSRTS